MTDQTAEHPAPPAVPKSKIKNAPAPKPRGTVIVCSKIEHDLALQCCVIREVRVQGRHGIDIEKQYHKAGDIHYVRGIGYPAGQIPKGFPRRPLMTEGDAGYALTYNIPADFWEQWLDQNKDTDMVRNRLIYAVATLDEACEIAAENKDVDSGLGPLVENDRRNPQPLHSAISKVTMDVESMDAR
jgi:hypothetical protein